MTLPRSLAGRFALLLAVAFVFGMLAGLFVLWASSGFGELIGGAPLFWALIGAGLSMALGAGLMAALFYSDRILGNRGPQ